MRYPRSGILFLENFRRMLIPKFPMAIYYIVDPTRVVVHSILDVRLDPATIQKILKKSWL